MSDTQPKLGLRELAREYAGGRIDRETFRRRRARLLDELAREPVSSRRPRPSPRPATASRSITGSVAGRRSPWPLLAVILGLLALALTGGWLLLRPPTPAPSGDLSERPEWPASPAAPPATPAPAPPNPAVARPAPFKPLQRFLLADDWSLPSRRLLMEQWRELEPRQRARVRRSAAFHVLEDELRKRIEEERSLAREQDSAKANSLLAFGQALGLVLLPALPDQQPTQPNRPDRSPSHRTGAGRQAAGSTEPPPLRPAKGSGVEHLPAPSKPPAKEMATGATPRVQPPAKVDAPPVAQPQATRNRPMLTVARETPHTGTEESESCHPYPGNQRLPKCRDPLQGGGKAPWLRLLPGGLFTMGSHRKTEESPLHRVGIDYPFAIGLYEITQAEFRTFCRDSGYPCPPQPWEGKELPVVNVSWVDATRYAKWLTRRTGRGYRLPTEAEWEYAARAGTTGPYPVALADLGSYAHYSRHGQEKRPLARYPQRTNPNPFGLFDMAGNVREWVIDSWSADYRGAPRDGSPVKHPDSDQGVVRGGSYADGEDGLRSAARLPLEKGLRDPRTGFRLVRDVYVKARDPQLATWGNWWLHYQPERQFTLQLLAVPQLERIRSLLDEFPNLSFKVIRLTGDGDYRLCYGLFDDVQAARNTYQRLPEGLRTASSGYRIKRIGELRGE